MYVCVMGWGGGDVYLTVIFRTPSLLRSQHASISVVFFAAGKAVACLTPTLFHVRPGTSQTLLPML